MQDFLYAVTETSYAALVRDSLWGYAVAESAHLIGIVIMFGAILLADLRIIGLGGAISMRLLTSGFLLRVTWIGFAIVVLSGLSLFSAYAPDTIMSPVFLAKMALIAAAGANMLLFTFRFSKGMDQWDTAGAVPSAARLSAACSITLWTLTIFAGRLIAYPEMFEAVF